jgi:hypothetical protein
MATFETLFPTFLQKCAELHELLRIVAFMLFIVGTILFVVARVLGQDAHAPSGAPVRAHGVARDVAAMGQPGAGASPDFDPQRPRVDPSNVQDQYNQLLVVKRDTGSDRSWWDILGDLNGFTVEMLISGILWLVGQFASLLLFWAYIIQKFILFTGYALSPLLIGFMAIRPLRPSAAVT